MEFLTAALGAPVQAAAWLGLLVVAIGLGALSAGPSSRRQLYSLPSLLACLLLPLLAPLPPLSRALLACLGMLGLLKILQLDFEARWGAHHPLWHGLSPFDVSKVRRADTRFDARLLGMLLLHALLLAAVVAGLAWMPAAGWPLRPAWRLLLGAALVYTAMETATEGLRFAHRLTGLDVPPIQRAPVLSRSVGEFWSRRWNRPVSDWLNEYVFLPLARRRRARLGLLAAFAASAAFHAWLYFVALGAAAAASVAGFFLLQAPVVMLETKLRVARWPTLAARAWTLAWLLVSSPLFVEPLLRGIGSR
jgi:hypothetical protein